VNARDQDWIDMSAFDDLDPDAVGTPAELGELRRALAATVEPDLGEPAWAAMLDRAVHPPDLVEAANEGFDGEGFDGGGFDDAGDTPDAPGFGGDGPEGRLDDWTGPLAPDEPPEDLEDLEDPPLPGDLDDPL
jgi:hypothetical protein